MFKGIRSQLLDNVPSTGNVVSLAPHDPDLPPPALHGTWRECKQHQRVIADIQARIAHAEQKKAQAISEAETTIRHAERELAEERAKYDAAKERWMTMSAKIVDDLEQMP